MIPEAEVNKVASRQGGVVSRAVAIGLGMTARQIDFRLSSGIWSPVVVGAYRIFDLDGPIDRVRAAVAILPGCVVSRHSAAILHGMDRVPDSMATVSVHTTTTHEFPGVQVVRCHDLLETHTTVVDSLPVTTVARTIVDLSAVLTTGQLEVTLDAVLNDRLATVGEVGLVLREVSRRGKPGVRQLRSELERRTGDDYSGSVLERKGIELLERAGCRGFATEYSIPWSPRQRFDVAFPSHRLAVEWDSRRWHALSHAFESDRERDRAALLHGWRVVRFTWVDVHERPDHVIRTIQRLLEL